MTQPVLIDHVVFVLLAVIYPLYWKITWNRRVRSGIETGGSSARLAAYRHGIVGEWLLTGVIVVCWFLAERTPAELGFGAPRGWWFWIGCAVFIAYATLGMRQVAGLRASAEARSKVRDQLRGDVALIIPRNAVERRLFIALSVTAGICEEVAYRGFLVWYLGAWLPAPAVVVAGAAIFGLAHLYLGWGHVLKTGAIGLVFVLAYLLTGTLWVPILLHATVDIVSGFAGHAAFDQPAEGTILSANPPTAS